MKTRRAKIFSVSRPPREADHIVLKILINSYGTFSINSFESKPQPMTSCLARSHCIAHRNVLVSPILFPYQYSEATVYYSDMGDRTASYDPDGTRFGHTEIVASI